MRITRLSRIFKRKKGLWISFDFKRDLYIVINEEIYGQAIDYMKTNQQIIPILNDDCIVIGFKEIMF